MTLGGEHSITPPLVAAFAKKYRRLSVLQIDAHADLRESYEGDRNSHACAAKRMMEHAPVVQVGIRNLSESEVPVVNRGRVATFFAHEVRDWKKAVPKILARTVLRGFYEKMGPARYYVGCVLLLVMLLMPVKMFLRWTLNMKYIVAIPEFSFNI